MSRLAPFSFLSLAVYICFFVFHREYAPEYHTSLPNNSLLHPLLQTARPLAHPLPGVTICNRYAA